MGSSPFRLENKKTALNIETAEVYMKQPAGPSPASLIQDRYRKFYLYVVSCVTISNKDLITT